MRPTRVHSAVLKIIFVADNEKVLTSALIKALLSQLYIYCDNPLSAVKARTKSGNL